MLGSQNCLDSDVLEGPPDPPVTVCISALEYAREKSNIFSLPGSKGPAAGCGDAIPYHCNHHDGGVWKRSHCNERGCPRCYERWTAREADNASLRVSWGAKYWQDRRSTILERKNAGSPLDPMWMSKKLLIGHFVVSMPDNLGLWIPNWSPEKARVMTYEICRRHRVCGGIVIFHPWRHDDDLQEYVPDGYWHFHIIGLHFEETTPGGSDVGPDGRTIVFKHVRDEEYQNYGGLRSQRGMSRLIRYQLTHAGLKDGTHALTYFGLCSFRKLPASEVHTTYPEALQDDSKTNPEAPSVCPACGSVDLEPCAYGAFAGREGLVQIHSHPDPRHAPAADIVDQAEQSLEDKFQNLYDNEPAPARRHDLTKERQRERGKLARRELEFFNIKDPLVEMWVWLRNILEDGSQFRSDLNSEDPELLDRVISLNLESGRLGETPMGRLSLKHEYDLDDALRDLRDIAVNGEPVDGSDWRLERLIVANAPDGNPLLTDYGYVFGIGGS